MAQPHAAAHLQHTSHGAGVGAVGRHQLAAVELHIRQKALVALQQHPLLQGLNWQHALGRGGGGWRHAHGAVAGKNRPNGADRL